MDKAKRIRIPYHRLTHLIVGPGVSSPTALRDVREPMADLTKSLDVALLNKPNKVSLRTNLKASRTTTTGSRPHD